MKSAHVPAWLGDLAKELGPEIVAELIKAGAKWILDPENPPMTSKLSSPVELLMGARRVRDLIPDPLPNDAVGAELAGDIADAEARIAAERERSKT